jgi:hypothetical protein
VLLRLVLCFVGPGPIGMSPDWLWRCLVRSQRYKVTLERRDLTQRHSWRHYGRWVRLSAYSLSIFASAGGGRPVDELRDVQLLAQLVDQFELGF